MENRSCCCGDDVSVRSEAAKTAEAQNPSRVLSGIVSGIQREVIPEETWHNAKLRILDFAASALAGYRINADASRLVADIYLAQGGVRQSTVFFRNEKLPAPNAALINAFYGHGADIDDGNRMASGHPGTCVVPAMLALAEAFGSSPEDVLLATISGYEVYVRLSSAVMPSHVQRGFHGTATVGTVAVAAAAAVPLRRMACR